MNDQNDEYRKHLVEARQKAQADYDKTVVLLAGGALGLSLSFLKNIVGKQTPKLPCALAVGWGLLVISLVFILASFCVSRFALGSAIRQFDDGRADGHRGCWAAITETCNIIAGLLVVAGIALVVLFAYANL
jgi:hypothetical protein